MASADADSVPLPAETAFHHRTLPARVVKRWSFRGIPYRDGPGRDELIKLAKEALAPHLSRVVERKLAESLHRILPLSA
jgi:hypothetical protein